MNPSILDQYFQSDTMSVHFKTQTAILTKSGRPGAWHSKRLDAIMSREQIEHVIQTIYEEIPTRTDAFLEIDKPLSKVIQLGSYRIVIVHPPLSDGLEMTVARPVKRLSIEDYELEERVVDLLLRQSKGVLISGSPGSGKSTFAQALVDEYQKLDKVIKTVESPRDLMVGEEVVQYSFSYGSHDEIRDILLLSRPDVTVYDEVRNRNDFELYKDLRLTGIGMIGVIHATKAVDSIQRFLGVIEMGIIPQVIDTVVYMDGGELKEIYSLTLTVGLPIGMQSADLARPVVEVTSFLTGEKEYQIYSYGEQVIVMPLKDLVSGGSGGSKAQPKSGLRLFAEQGLREVLQRRLDCRFALILESMNSISIYAPEQSKGGIIGKGGANIMKLEKELGVSISLRSFEDMPTEPVRVTFQGKKQESASLTVGSGYANTSVRLLLGGEVIESFECDSHGEIFIDRRYLVKLVARGVKRIV